jgi:hypothetical protein
MLRYSIRIVISLAIFSVLTACAHSEIIGRGETLQPKNGVVKQSKTVDPKEDNSKAQKPKEGIIGRWEALEPKSGLVNILDFQQDGKTKSSLLARVYTHYHVEGNKLILVPDSGKAKQDEKSPSSDQGGEPVVYSFVLEKDRLKMTLDKTGEVLDMKREGPATAPDSIIGHWSYKHESGETATQIFDANGTNLIKLPMPGGVEGTYEVKGDVITVTSLDKKHSQTASFKMENGQMVLNDGKKITRYVRIAEPQ